jgi:DNA-binding CsgD family transcriptional regulator
VEPLAVQVSPLRTRRGALGWMGGTACAVVFCAVPGRVPPPTAEMLRALYGLTRAEAALVNELASGRSLEESAAALRISRATARNQLKVAFQKTGTHRQAGLLRLVLSLPGSIVSPR